MRGGRLVRMCAGLLGAAFLSAVLAAQEPTPAARPRTPRPNMQAMNEALGVTCNYCHVPNPRYKDELDYKSDANPRKRVARLMVAMTADINASIPAAVLKASREATEVTCATCHRGVADPRPLPDIIGRVVEEQGVDQALAHYRNLRAQYYGKDAYDFSEPALLNVARRFVERSPEVALALMRTNLEFYPSSAESYVLMAVAETRRFDDGAAIRYLEKALTLNPAHGLAQGYLSQLQQYRKPRRP
ncbi:MAG: c-type cytochrome [Vicinamibacterales bacterium]